MSEAVVQRGSLRLVHDGSISSERANDLIAALASELALCGGEPPPPRRLELGAELMMAKRGKGSASRRLLRFVTRSPSRSLAAYRVGVTLRANEVPTPLPVAALERRRAGVTLGDVLVTEWVDAPDLSRLLVSAGEDERASLISSAARSIAALHAARCCHRDLKASNLLSTPQGEGLLLADLDGAWSSVKAPSHQRRVRDLSRLILSLVVFPGGGEALSEPSDEDIVRACSADGALLIERYLEASPGLDAGGDLLQVWQAQALAWLREKVRVNRRAGRPLS